MTVVSGEPEQAPLRETCEAAKLTLPVPARDQPSVGHEGAPVCSAIFTCAGVSMARASSSSATPPLTTAADMLVPLKR